MRMFENRVVLIIFVLGTIMAVHGNSEFNEDMLNLHNKYRKIHHSGELFLDTKMSDEAMECAKNIMQGISTSCEHNWSYGTNLFSLTSPYKLTAQRVFLVWYNNKKDYDYINEPKVDSDTNSFTQIVWKDTKKLGLAFLHENDGYVIVAAYDPPGNIMDKYSKNVLRPSK